MTDYRSLYRHAETVLAQLKERMQFSLAGSDLKVELGTPRDMSEDGSVAVIFRRGDGTRAPLEVVVYAEGIAVGEVTEGRSERPRYFIGRLRPHRESDCMVMKVCERLRDLAPISETANKPQAPQITI